MIKLEPLILLLHLFNIYNQIQFLFQILHLKIIHAFFIIWLEYDLQTKATDIVHINIY